MSQECFATTLTYSDTDIYGPYVLDVIYGPLTNQPQIVTRFVNVPFTQMSHEYFVTNLVYVIPMSRVPYVSGDPPTHQHKNVSRLANKSLTKTSQEYLQSTLNMRCSCFGCVRRPKTIFLDTSRFTNGSFTQLSQECLETYLVYVGPMSLMY